VDRRTLVERAGRGDHDAFALLATAAAARLDAAARLILRDPELARDAVQNTLVEPGGPAGLCDRDRFDAWLHRLADPAPTMAPATPAIELAIETTTNPLGDAPAASPTGTSSMSAHPADPEHRVLVVLHYYFGYPLPEAAKSLGISLPAAKSRLHRAMQGLRRSMSAEPPVVPVGGHSA
jgi:DNA-directed RNA polymerase specialized sigma24 family protein